MKLSRKYIISLTVALASVGLSSCSDFLKEYSQDLAKVEGWQDLDEVLLGDAYMHSSSIGISNSQFTFASDGDSEGLNVLHYMTDEIVLSSMYDNDNLGIRKKMFPFYTWQQDTGVDEDRKYVGGDQRYWNDMYSRINVCNMVLSLIDEQPERELDDATQKRRVKGEAHFLRGMFYFYLANLYATPYEPASAASTPGVAIKTSEFIEDITYTRSSLEQTYVQIVDDLTAAADLLSETTPKTKYHASAEAALLMLSRVYLYMQDWAKAVTYADKVLALNSRLLNLSTVAIGDNSVSLGSPETIFSMGQYLIAANFADDRYGDYEPFFSISDEIMELFDDPDDLRAKRYVGRTADGYYENVFLKYHLQRTNWGGMNDVSSYCLLRTPEAYLIKAEALAYQGKDTEACKVLDTYLATRFKGYSPLSLSGEELITFIREERAREFLLEGHRWFDLRRYTVCEAAPWSKTINHSYYYYRRDGWKTVVDYVDTYRLEANDQGYTLPIPRSVREQNIELGNNPRPARQPMREVDDGDDDDD